MYKRHVIVLVISLLFVSLSFSACKNGNIKNSEEVKSEVIMPKFYEINQVREDLKSAKWGSQGWEIYSSEKPLYLYAVFGRYMLRYNISENKMDRAIEYENGFSDSIFNLSSDGKYVIVSKLFDNTENAQLNNTFLIDFESNEIKYWEDLKEGFDFEEIPEAIRDEFEVAKINEYTKLANSEILKYSIDYDATSGSYFARSKEDLAKVIEITVLKNKIFEGERTFIYINSNTIGTLIPSNDNAIDLGYYKFVLIDIEKDKVIQESLINEE